MKNTKRTTILLVCCLLFSVAAFGQGKFAEAIAQVSPEKISPGESGELRLTLRIPEKTHVNSAFIRDPNMIPTSFTIQPVEGIIWHETEYPEAVEVTEWYSSEPLKVYRDKAVIKVPFTVAKEANGTKKLEGTLFSQACDDEKCYPPKKVAISITLQINSVDSPQTAEPSSERSTLRAVTPITTTSDPINFPFTDYSGSRRTISDYRGKVVLLDFWATWCKPCLADFPKLKILYAKYQKQGFEIIGLQAETLGDSEADSASLAAGLLRGRAIVKRFDTDWTMVEPASAVESGTKSLKIEALPTKILLDRNGRILRIIKANDDLESIIASLF